jgi:hypothetical protein
MRTECGACGRKGWRWSMRQGLASWLCRDRDGCFRRIRQHMSWEPR